MLKLFMAGMLATQAAAAPPAPPARPPCLTRAQFGNFGVVGVAMFVSVAQNACRQHLRPGAFLTSDAGNAYVANLRAEGRARLPSTIDAMVAVVPSGPAASPTLMRGMFNGLLSDDAGREWSAMVTPALCSDADELIEAASVMTPERTARFMGAFASLADNVYRMMPQRPAPPAAAPAGRPQPLAFTRGATPPPGAQPPQPRPPVPPFLCRPGA